MIKWLATLFFLCLLPTLALADNANTEKNSLPLYVGLTKNDSPYSKLDKKGDASGILVDFTNSLCLHLNRKCNYLSGDYHQLLNKLATQQIDVLLINDHIVMPEVDKIQITPPVCKMNPVFVQRSTADIYIKQAEDLKGKRIGVKADSALYLYLMKNYTIDYIKTYNTLNSAAFDLFVDRLDAIFVGKAFYQDKIYDNSGPLGNPEHDFQLVASEIDGIIIPYANMSLAFSEREKSLHDKTVEFINQSRKNIPDCESLINKKLAIIY